MCRTYLRCLSPAVGRRWVISFEDVFYTDKRSVPREDWEWLRSIRAGGVRLGLDLDCGRTVCRYMEEVGFVDV